jgi:hypothetical protein
LGIGTITIWPNIGGRDPNRVSLTVRNVWYIPGFHTNIISSAQMANIGLEPLLGQQIVTYKGEFWCRIKQDANLYIIEAN